MWSKMQRRYFIVLLVPSMIILLLGMWLAFYSHRHGMDTMQRDMEISRQQAVESVGSAIDALFQQASMNAVNLSFQLDAMQNNNASQIAQFNSAIDQLLFMQANSISLFNPLVERCYIFLFDENRVITLGSTSTAADSFYRSYLRIGNADYEDFKKNYTEGYYAGTVLPDVSIGYMQSAYEEWIMVQTFPIDPSLTHRGVIIFTLNNMTVRDHLKDGLMDGDSICALISGGAVCVSQGANRHWQDSLVDELLNALLPDRDGTQYVTLSDGKSYMVTSVFCTAGRILSAQPQTAVFLNMNHYNSSMLILMVGVILLAVMVAMVFTNRNVAAMTRVISTIPEEHQADSATNVFNYMEKAFINAQQKEALLSARTREQKSALTANYIRSLFHGEWQSESEALQEQDRIGISIEAQAYTVLLVRIWEKAKDRDQLEVLRNTLNREFGEDKAYVIAMSQDHAACLLLADDNDLRESIEAVADELTKALSATTLVSNMVTSLLDIAQAYRQVRVMSRMIQNSEEHLHWYRDLFQDDVLYNFEYSVYSETGLRNNIAAGNEQGTLDTLNGLYEKNLKRSVYSDHVLRFFAYDLYRLVNHLSASNAADDQKDAMEQIRRSLDHVMDNPKQFEGFFQKTKDYCLELCRQNENRRISGSDESLSRINQYIDSHFTDPDMTVASIADALGISGKYLSLFYREQTGEKISVQIEKKRIEEACRLLNSTDMTINDIALASGYALTHTFRVAFKKVQGVTPLEWKRGRMNL